MQINIHHTDSDFLVHAKVRMNRQTFEALRSHMHGDPKKNEIDFPGGVRLIKYGYGWYKLTGTHLYKGVEKLQFAAKLIYRFYKEEEARVEQEIKALLAKPAPALHQISIIAQPVYPVRVERRSEPRTDASVGQLQALASHFNHRRLSR